MTIIKNSVPVAFMKKIRDLILLITEWSPTIGFLLFIFIIVAASIGSFE